MPSTAFAGGRALELLRALAQRAAVARDAAALGPDALGLVAALRASGAELLDAAASGPSLAAPLAAPLAAQVRGREPGPPWLLCTPCYVPAAPGDPPWRPNAHGSGAALLLALLECLATGAPAQDMLCLFFAAPPDSAAPLPAAEAWAARELLPLRGALAVWQVAGPGAALDLDVRSLGHPEARALAHELFLLGRVLGQAPFARGVQTAFPGLHVPLLERGLPALPLCANGDLLAGSEDDTLANASAASLQAIGETLLRFLRGERAV
jgi:hypothetical protein